MGVGRVGRDACVGATEKPTCEQCSCPDGEPNCHCAAVQVVLAPNVLPQTPQKCAVDLGVGFARDKGQTTVSHLFAVIITRCQSCHYDTCRQQNAPCSICNLHPEQLSRWG